MVESLDVAFFPALRDTTPLQVRLSWDECVERLSQHREQPFKDGPGFSAALYEGGKTRGNEGVKSLSAAVVDVDHAEPMWDLLNGLEYVAFTSYSHGGGEKCGGRTDCPHWRIVLPFTRSVPRDQWPDLRARVKFWLVPNADDGAKDAARFNYLPACRAGAPRETRRGRGAFLNPDTLAPVPVPPSSAPSERTNGYTKPASSQEERPGDRFNATATWAEILEPHGWRWGGSSGDTQYWIRPGKRDAGHSATADGGNQRVLYVFSSEAAPFDPDTSYTRFRAYSLLKHNGDDTAAARELADRFGMTSPKATGKRVRPRVSAEPQEEQDEEIAESGLRPLTQLGNSERLVDQFGDRLLYSFVWSSWLVWDGKRWKKDESGQVMTWAKEVARNILLEAHAEDNDVLRRALIKWSKETEKAAQLEAMISLARSAVPVGIDQFDTDIWLLNVRNGTVDLRTGELSEHRRSDFITKIVDLDYDPSAACPLWESVLERVLPDESVRQFFQRAAGYSATGSARERKLIIPHGPGRNGKGVTLETLLQVLGEYAGRTPAETFMARREGSIPNNIAALRGVRFVFSSETNEGHRLAEAVVKDLTGGESISARFMRGEWFTFPPTFTPWLATNHRPVIRGSDPAIWDRIALVPFNVRIPDDEQDPDLLEKLEDEYPGILAWIINGAVEWHKHGLKVPDAVRMATDSYQAEMDILGLFVNECCVEDPDERTGWVTSTSLYEAYMKWCKDSGEKELPKRTLGLRLAERGYVSAKVGSQRGRGWIGLRLLSEGEELPL